MRPVKGQGKGLSVQIYIMSWSLAESARLVEHEKHGNLFCGKCDGERRKRPLPVLVFVRAQKGKSCEKGNINKRQILKIAK